MAMLHLRVPIARRVIGKVRALRCQDDGRSGLTLPAGPRRVAPVLPTAVGVVHHATTVAGAVAATISVLVPQALLLSAAPRALRWRLETFGLYMPSLPEARPWWRPNPRALRALARQLPGYARWLGEMQALRHAGARGWWRHQTGTDAREWEGWLALALQETDE
jgi:hypothetical protein